MRHLFPLSLCLLASAFATPAVVTAQSPTFSSPRQISFNQPTGDRTGIYLTGNFNGNGNTDIIASMYDFNTSQTSFEFLTGDGTGNFSVTGPITSLPPTNFNLVADVNGDGKDDIITLLAGCEELPCSNNANEGDGDGIFTVMLSHGNGVFTQGFVGTLPSGLDNVTGVVADFNKDGKPDVAVLANGDLSNTAELCIFINNGNGTFTQTDYQTPESLWRSPTTTTNLVVGDFEGNGNQDLALAFDTTDGFTIPYPEVMTFAGNGKGAFGPGVVSYNFDSSFSPPFPFLLFSADLNRDGRTDLLIALDAKAPNQATGSTRIPSILANASGRFYWGSAVYLSHSIEIQSNLLDDFNGDGKPDYAYVGLAPSGSTTALQAGIYLGLGNGAFATPHIPINLGKVAVNASASAFSARLKTGALPSLFIAENGNTYLLVNTTPR